MRPARRETICRSCWNRVTICRRERRNTARNFGLETVANLFASFYGMVRISEGRNLLRQILFSRLTAFSFSLLLFVSLSSSLSPLVCLGLPSLTRITTPTQRDARQSTAPTCFTRSHVPPHDKLRLIPDNIIDLHDKSLTRNVSLDVASRSCRWVPHYQRWIFRKVTSLLARLKIDC